MMRLSERRALGIIVAACKTRVLWFDLEADFEETHNDEADAELEDEHSENDCHGRIRLTKRKNI